MSKSLNKWLAPALFALILFLCIRVASDIPKRVYYWEGKEPGYMLKDILVVFVMAYPIIFGLRYWLYSCRRKKRVWWHEYGVVVLIASFGCLFTMWIIRLLMGESLDWYDVPIPAVVSVLLLGFYYAFLRSRLIQEENKKHCLQLERIKNDQLRTELKFLKAQYHPHFLFNMLNTVYFQIDEKNEAPRRTLEQLSELLRYQLYNEQEKVQVSVEMNFLKQYIDLCKLRATKRLRLQVHFDEAAEEYEVYPLLFVPLVENAFKYVGGKFYITLAMRLKDGVLHFEAENSVPEALVRQENKRGIGLDNLRRRLDLLYPKRYVLDICKGDACFVVKLTVKL